jgi:hypothetical protein
MVRTGAGYLRQYVYRADGADRTCTGTGANGWDGWGYSVSHYSNTASTSKSVTTGTYSAIFTGRHHAIYEYKYNQSINSRSVAVTIHWMFAGGRDNPVFAVTYDMSAHPAGSIVGDTRTPYGDLGWAPGGSAVSGVGWGDRYKFITTSEPLTMNSTWTYNQANTVPYVLEWETGVNAEMGAVQTQTYLQHDAGGYWFYGNWGKTSTTQTRGSGQAGNMPETWNWTYQLNQYELCIDNVSCVNNTTGSRRLAWGANFGAMGGVNSTGKYQAYGDWTDPGTLTGHPYQSYAVFMVLGKHSDAPVFAQVANVEAVQRTTLTASRGTVATTGPGGVGRTDNVTLAPVGYDARYSTFNAVASNDALTLTATVSSGTLKSPVLVVSNYTAAADPVISVGGQTAVADKDFLLSRDTAGQKLWITFRPGWTGTTQIVIN